MDNILTELQKLRPQQLLTAIVVFLGVLCPGFLLLFHYKPALIAQLDIAKLTVLSCSLTLPLFLINLGLSNYCLWKSPELGLRTAHYTAPFMAALLSALALYGGLFCVWLNHQRFRYFLLMVLLFEILFALVFANLHTISREKPAQPKE